MIAERNEEPELDEVRVIKGGEVTAEDGGQQAVVIFKETFFRPKGMGKSV